MKKNEILEGNKLIAEFFTKEKFFNHSIVLNGFDEETDLFFDNQLKFNSSWDWIMPVVMEIEELGYEINIKGIKCSVNCVLDENPIISYVLGEKSKKIELLFTVIVEFIKWYNENNKNN